MRFALSPAATRITATAAVRRVVVNFGRGAVGAVDGADATAQQPVRGTAVATALAHTHQALVLMHIKPEVMMR